jgi:hypothetical protein
METVLRRKLDSTNLNAVVKGVSSGLFVLS